MSESRKYYLVICRSHSVNYIREIDMPDANRTEVLNRIVRGEFNDVVRVLLIDEDAGIVINETVEFAFEAAKRFIKMMDRSSSRFNEPDIEIPTGFRRFIESNLGVGTVLPAAA